MSKSINALDEMKWYFNESEENIPHLSAPLTRFNFAYQ